jgi:hypothetical protein
MNAPIQIRKPEVVSRIRRLAQRKGKSITDTIQELAEREQDRLDSERDAELSKRRARVEATLARLHALPITGPLLTDDDLYGADGLPIESGR